MAVMIKDIEMPNSCFLCRFCRRQEYGEYVGEDTAWSCVASKKRITDGQDLIATFKHPDCPLVEAAEVKDAVSRQAGIDVIRFECGEWTGLAKTIENKINELPPAQPEIEERMSETEQNVPNDDFISRKRAIDALMEDFKRIPTNAIRAKTVIEQLPPAKPEIIRCKDCKYADPFGHCDYVNFWNAINDFCSRAERKENR